MEETSCYFEAWSKSIDQPRETIARSFELIPNKFEEGEFIKVPQVFPLRGNSEQVFTRLHGQDRVIPAFSVVNFFVPSF